MSGIRHPALGALQRFLPKADPAILAVFEQSPEILEEAGLLANPLRLCHFLAQAAHETAGFTTLVEKGGASYFTRRYGRRRDLGNLEPSDGPRYRGRGIFQLTGRANYRLYGGLVGIDLEAEPARAGKPLISLRVACAYWTRNRLNRLADANDIRGITRRINGGFNGLSARARLFRRAMAAFAPAADEGFLRIGSIGAAVRRLQLQLRTVGHAIVVDGQFGRRTEAALRAFQRTRGLAVDGIFGPRTEAALAAAAKSLPQTKKETSMDQWKSYLQSRTIWANLIGFAALALNVLGFHGLSGDDQAHLVDALLKFIEAGGFVAGVVFRAVARDRLGPSLR